MIRRLFSVVLLVPASACVAQEHCAALLGGCYFIDCKSLIRYHGQDVVRFGDWSDPLGSVDLDVYSAAHQLEAQVRAGKLVKGSADRFKITRSASEFNLVDASTDRIICILKKVPSTTKESSCQVNVWLDLYVSGAGYFHCDPQKSNEPFMQYMGGAVFKNNQSAIVLE